jgi:adenylate cyclase
MAHDIFISYSSKDRAEASNLVRQLQSAGFDVWIDSRGIGAATSWSKEIAIALEECSVVCVLLSENSLASHNVAKEVGVAAELGKQFLPIELEIVRLRGEFLYHLANFHRVKIDNVEAVTEALDKIGLKRNYQPAPVTTTSYGSTPAVQSDILRLAVLPFEDLSPAHDNDWFADGLTDELISMLGKLDKLFVVDKQTSRQQKNTTKKSKDIAIDLGVQYITRGSVRKAANAIRVQSDLVDTDTGATLWDEKFPGTMDDIFEIQESIARQITDGLSIHLTPKEKKDLLVRPTENIEAYELFLKANSYHDKQTKEGFRHAIEIFKRALQIDPGFILSYINVAREYSCLYQYYDEGIEALEIAEEYLSRTPDGSPWESSKLLAKSRLSILRGKHTEAIHYLEQTIALRPNDATIREHAGIAYAGTGNFEKAASEFSESLRLDPHRYPIYYSLALAYRLQGQMKHALEAAEEGVPFYKKHVEANPDDQATRQHYAILLLFSGREEESFHEMESLAQLPGIDGNVLHNMASAYLDAGKFDKALEFLHKSLDKGSRVINLEDESYEPVRTHPEFIRLTERLSSRAQKESALAELA